MPNAILTIDMITRKCLEILENNLVITRNINRQYDDSFANAGAKIGSNLRIRLPDRVLVSNGAALQVQDTDEQFVNFPVTSQKHVGINFTTAELTMSMDDFAERILEPRVSQLAASIDADVAGAFTDIFQSVGTPGSVPSTSLVLLQAQQKLNESAVGLSPRFATVSPAANAGLVEGMKGFFNPTSTISRQFKSGMMGEGVLGFNEINMSQSVRTFTTGTRTNGTTSAAVATQGATSLALTGLGANATIRNGEVLTVANVFAVNPQTRESTGSLQDFVAVGDFTATAGGAVTVTVSPPIFTSTQALATVDSFPASGAVVTFRGAASTVFPQNLVYHRNAITFATADLIMPRGVDMASRQNHGGISMRIVRQYDINNDRMPCRIDVLYGYKVIRPPMAVRMWG